MMISKSFFSTSFLQTRRMIFLLVLSLTCPLQGILATEEDDFYLEERTTNHPKQSTREDDEDSSDEEEDWLSKFKENYTLQSLTRPSSSSDDIEVVVVDDDTHESTTLKGTLVKDPKGKNGLKQDLCLKHRYDHPKPELGETHDLEPLMQWFRETVSYPTFAIQLTFGKHTIVLDEFQEVSPLSAQLRNNTVVKVVYQPNAAKRSVDLSVELTCPLKEGPFQAFLGDVPYQFVDSHSQIEGYTVSEGMTAPTITQVRKTETRFRFPHLPQVQGLDKPHLLTPFRMPGTEKNRLSNIKATLLKPSSTGSSVPLKKKAKALFGSYKLVAEFISKSPYLYVETTGRKPEFFLTRTQEATLIKGDQSGIDQEMVVLKFTQKIGLTVDAQLVDASVPLRTGLLQQTALGKWCPVSSTYDLLKHAPSYQFKILKVKTTESLPPSQLLEALEQASDIFYSRFMTLELPHPLLSEGSIPPLPTVLDQQFTKIISQSYPPFPLPQNLRVLEVGGDDQPRLVMTTAHCNRLRGLPLNRLTLINVEMTEENMKQAMEDYEGGHVSEFSVELRKGHVLETFEKAPPNCLFKHFLQRARDEQTDQEHRDHCRTYRPL